MADHAELIARACASKDHRDIGVCPIHWETAEVILAALAAEGRVIVPEEPTKAMTDAGLISGMAQKGKSPKLHYRNFRVGDAYRAMIKAAGGDDE